MSSLDRAWKTFTGTVAPGRKTGVTAAAKSEGMESLFYFSIHSSTFFSHGRVENQWALVDETAHIDSYAEVK